MIQIRRNGLLTVIKVDVITRDVKAVTELRETLISPPSVCSQVKQGRYLNNITLRHNVLPLPGKINKRQYHHRKINKPIKQDWSQQKQLDRNQMIFNFQVKVFCQENVWLLTKREAGRKMEGNDGVNHTPRNALSMDLTSLSLCQPPPLYFLQV